VEDIRFYDFLLKLNTYLNRMNLLADKFRNQEAKLAKDIAIIQTNIPPEAFSFFFAPLQKNFEDRVKLMTEFQEAGDVFKENLKEFYDLYKGIVQ
jgi:hypothetical protein